MRFNLKKVASRSLILLMMTVMVFGVSMAAFTPTAKAVTCSAGQVHGVITDQGTGTATEDPSSCVPAPQGSTEITCNGLGSCFVLLLYYVGPAFASSVAYIGAYFFSITTFLALNSTAYALQFLTDGWITVRDLANMAFIFILIYIAMTVMLQAETSGTIKTLSIVIVVALLVNFSFFFTRVVVDTGNILALQFYNAIPYDPVNGIIQGTGIKDLSASIMGAVKPQTLLNAEMFKRTQDLSGNSTSGAVAIYAVIYLSMAAMLWMLFFAFIQVGIKFMLRIVGLWFILIVSPLAFVARTIRQTEHYFSQWWDALIQFSAYPAVFLFIFLILTKLSSAVLTGNTSNGAQGDFFSSIINSAAGTGNPADQALVVPAIIASVAIRMGFIIAMLYVGLKVSDMVVKEGSSIAGKAGNWTGGLARGAMKYGPGWATGAVYRRSVGALANAASDKVQGSRWANRPGTFGGLVGYRLNRNVLKPLTETSLGTVASTYKERAEFLDKRKEEMDKNLGNHQFVKDSKRLGQLDAQAAPMEARIKEIEERAAKITDPRAKSIAEAGKRPFQKVLDPINTERAILARRIEKAADSKMAMLGATDVGAIIKRVSESQLKAIKESNKHSVETIKELSNKWHEENKKAPMGESKKQIEELYKIREILKKKKFETQNLTPLFDKLASSIKGEVTSLKAAEDAKKQVTAMREKLEDTRDAKRAVKRDDPEAIAADLQARELKKAEDRMEKLIEKLKEVPEGVGGEAAPAAFKNS